MNKKFTLLLLSLFTIACKLSFAQPGSCSSLLTYCDAQRSIYGIMFDIEAKEDIAITFLDNYFAGPGHVAVYYKDGTHKGYDKLADWTLVDTFWHNDFRFARLPFPISKFLGKGQRMAFFIQTDRLLGIGSRDIINQDTMVAQDAFLKILDGSEVDTDMVQTLGQAFVGALHYCPVGQDACFTDWQSNYSNFRDGAFTFDLRATKDITITQIGFEVRRSSSQFTLYSKQGSYRGAELDSSLWTHQASVTIPVLPVRDSSIMITLPQPMDIDSGNTVAFYFSGIPQSVMFNWPPDSLTVYHGGGLYDIYPGKSFYSKFYIPQYYATWAPRLELCWRNSAIYPLAINSVYSLDISVYPNPTSDVLNISTNNHEAVSLDLIDMQGRVVMKTIIQGATTLDVAQLPASVYQLYLHNANGTAVKRFVKN